MSPIKAANLLHEANKDRNIQMVPVTKAPLISDGSLLGLKKDEDDEEEGKRSSHSKEEEKEGTAKRKRKKKKRTLLICRRGYQRIFRHRSIIILFFT